MIFHVIWIPGVGLEEFPISFKELKVIVVCFTVLIFPATAALKKNSQARYLRGERVLCQTHDDLKFGAGYL